MAQTNNSRESRLLSLPPEIRNMIYRYSIVEGRISIPANSSPPHQPGLLQVSSQVRSEAVNIHYQENEFTWTIGDFDANKHIRWYGSSGHRKKAICRWKVTGRRNWRNILHWLESIYEKRARGPRGRVRSSLRPRPLSRIMLHLVNTTERLKEEGLSWKQIQRPLDDMYKMFATIDSKWA